MSRPHAPRARSFARDDDAQSLVEFAFILPIVLLAILGLLDVSRAVWQETTLAFAAREGTRYGIVHGSSSLSPVAYCPGSCSPVAVVAAVQNAAVGVPNITVTVTFPDGNNDRNGRVSVTAMAPFVPLASQFLLNGALSVTMRGASQLVIEN